VLIGGDPGIGKSTLLLQALAHLSSAQQGALRQRRGIGRTGGAARAPAGLDTRQLQLMAEINLERILATLQAESRWLRSSTRSRPCGRTSCPVRPVRWRRSANARRS
jgi:predicted ATP-dependent serine protease